MRRTPFASLTPAPPTIYFVPLSRNSYLAGPSPYPCPGVDMPPQSLSSSLLKIQNKNREWYTTLHQYGFSDELSKESTIFSSSSHNTVTTQVTFCRDAGFSADFLASLHKNTSETPIYVRETGFLPENPASLYENSSQ